MIGFSSFEKQGGQDTRLINLYLSAFMKNMELSMYDV